MDNLDKLESQSVYIKTNLQNYGINIKINNIIRLSMTYIVLPDHGVEKIGIFGGHSRYGFWSTGLRDLGNPKITDFEKIIKEL
jgi:hypothetical protein